MLIHRSVSVDHAAGEVLRSELSIGSIERHELPE